jgi:hypothetical protein
MIKGQQSILLLMLLFNTNHLLLENLAFFAIATSFLAIVGWSWRSIEPYELPKPLPDWFKVWFLSVQFLGVVPPLAALIIGGIWQGNFTVLAIFSAYFLMLGLQILSESLSLRRFQSTAFVMVPYLYLPYRFWQLYEGLTLLNSDSGLAWVRYILMLEIVVWMINYCLDLAQLPRLFHWKDISSGG